MAPKKVGKQKVRDPEDDYIDCQMLDQDEDFVEELENVQRVLKQERVNAPTQAKERGEMVGSKPMVILLCLQLEMYLVQMKIIILKGNFAWN
ncbi:uncharacterized protein [Triticum aestivum]|uniref:uncharacterized protein n=1 Tax=Triticum aestivum TaxID=4565 RepID=UPI001D023DA4|nr:uncharacterized protein LOC123049535 [Triticum aestivum]